MDFDQLHTFLEIVRLNSFSKAAKTCYRTQPAISAQIRQMEQELGTRLFDRFGSKITLTTAGGIFAKYARRLLDLRREGFDKVRELEHIARGEMSIAANEATCIHVLPSVFARYKQQFPEVRLQVVRAYGAAIFDSVVDNSVDFGITQLPLHDKRIAVVQIYSDEVMLLTGAKHRFAKRRTITAEEVVQEDLLLPKAGRTRRRIDEYLDPYEDDVRVSMELESSEMQKRFTEAGLGVTFMAVTSAREEVRSGRLRAIRLLPLPLIRTIGLIYRKDKALSLAALGLIRLVGEFAAQTGLGLPSVMKAS
ncbi:MAG: LysR family transcriptional regulator [Bryobacterales bacterium]|nr:LysR family transcriptional regulator [Bryobacterales bacterium]